MKACQTYPHASNASTVLESCPATKVDLQEGVVEDVAEGKKARRGKRGGANRNALTKERALFRGIAREVVDDVVEAVANGERFLTMGHDERDEESAREIVKNGVNVMNGIDGTHMSNALIMDNRKDTTASRDVRGNGGGKVLAWSAGDAVGGGAPDVDLERKRKRKSKKKKKKSRHFGGGAGGSGNYGDWDADGGGGGGGGWGRESGYDHGDRHGGGGQ